MDGTWEDGSLDSHGWTTYGAHLEAVTNVIRDQEVNQFLHRLAAEDPARWNPVLHAVSTALEDRPGTVARVLATLSAALEDQRPDRCHAGWGRSDGRHASR